MPNRDESSRESFARAARPTEREQEGRGSTMVANDRPYPAPRPSPGFAQEVGRAAFNASWDREVREADQKDRNARKDAFKAMRTEAPEPGRSRTFNRATAR